MHLRPVIVSPADRDFGDFEPLLARQKDKLHVESPAMDTLLRKDGLCGRPRKGLEAALGIVEIQPHQNSQKKVEGARIDPPQQRLALKLERNILPSGADSNIGPGFERGEKLVGLNYWRRKISIGKQQELASGIQHAIANGISFTLVPRITNNLYLRVRSGEAPDNLHGRVIGAVIDDQQFGAPFLFMQVFDDTLKRAANPPALVVGGND